MPVMTLDNAELEQCRDCRNDCCLKRTCGLAGSGGGFRSSQTWWMSYYSSRESYEKLRGNDLIESCQADGTTQQKQCQTSVGMCSVAYTGSAAFTLLKYLCELTKASLSSACLPLIILERSGEHFFQTVCYVMENIQAGWFIPENIE